MMPRKPPDRIGGILTREGYVIMVMQRIKLLLLCCALLAPSAAFASPTYTVTDLGSNGNEFPFTPNRNDLPADWNSAPGGVPILQPAPFSSEPPDPASQPLGLHGYSYSMLYNMNANGLAVGINTYGADGSGYHVQYSEVFAVQRQPDGSWGNPEGLWGGAPVYITGFNGLVVGGISNTGQIVGAGPLNPSLSMYSDAPKQWWIYDTKDHSLATLESLLPRQDLHVDSASIDADGQILVRVLGGPPYQNQPDYLLLTPTGTPTPTPVPEPTCLSLLVAAVCGGLLRRRASLAQHLGRLGSGRRNA